MKELHVRTEHQADDLTASDEEREVESMLRDDTSNGTMLDESWSTAVETTHLLTPPVRRRDPLFLPDSSPASPFGKVFDTPSPNRNPVVPPSISPMRWSGQRVPLPVPRKRGLKWAMDYIAVPPIRQGLTTADYKRPAPGSMRVPKLPSQHIALSAPSGLRIVIPAPNSIRRGGGTATCSASGGSCNSTTNGCPKSKCTGKRVDRHGRGCLSEHCARCVQSWCPDCSFDESNTDKDCPKCTGV